MNLIKLTNFLTGRQNQLLFKHVILFVMVARVLCFFALFWT